MTNSLIIFGKTFNNVAGIKATDDNNNTITYINPTGTKQISISADGTVTQNVLNYANVEISVNTGNSWPEQTINSTGNVVQVLQPGTIYHFTSNALSSLSLSFSGSGTNEQYHFDFISSTTPVILTLPSSVIMENSFTVEANTKYEIDIYNNEGVFAEWVYRGNE